MTKKILIEIKPSGMTPQEAWNKRIALMNRARPREHARTGSVTAKGYRSPTIVNAGLTINQVGARPLMHRNHTYYELGGGLFTKKQILESRRRFGEIKYNTKVSNAKKGMI